MSEKEYKIKCENLFKKNTVLLNQQKIDAEQIRALQKQNGELTDENERLKGNLELWESGACRATNLDKCGVVKELEAQIKKMQDDIDCLTFACENYREEMEKNLADATELEKENAELKDDNKVMADNYSKMEQKFYDNLTKAKELLKRCYDNYICLQPLRNDIEQFLSEVEK